MNINIHLLSLLTELVSSEALTLKELFPGYKGVLPPITVFNYPPDARINNLYKYGYLNMHNPPRNDFLARGHVIVAWRRVDNVKQRGDYIEPLWKLLSPPSELFWVYDTIRDDWIMMQKNEFEQLGFGHVFQLLHAREQVAATTKLRAGRPDVDPQAHNYACNKANSRMGTLEADLIEELRRGRTTTEASSASIWQKYTHYYTMAFSHYISNQGSNYHRHRHSDGE